MNSILGLCLGLGLLTFLTFPPIFSRRGAAHCPLLRDERRRAEVLSEGKSEIGRRLSALDNHGDFHWTVGILVLVTFL